MSTRLRIHKLTALPSSITPNTMYIIAPPGSPNYIEIYVSNQSGTAIRRVINESDVMTLIQNYLSGINNIHVVPNIAARNALNPNRVIFVLVLDATGDPSVSSGSASYVYDPSTSQWVKVAEYESMDVVLNWNNITGRPNATPLEIDDAVAKRHTHTNLTQLNKIGESADGYLMYNNKFVMEWESVDW